MNASEAKACIDVISKAVRIHRIAVSEVKVESVWTLSREHARTVGKCIGEGTSQAHLLGIVVFEARKTWTDDDWRTGASLEVQRKVREEGVIGTDVG